MDVDRDALSPQLLARPWWIGLDGWVLQDGNYTDFATGERRQFALEFGYQRWKRLRAAAPSEQQTRCRHSGRDATYEVTGQLLRSTDEPAGDAFVLDVGLGTYCEWMVLDDLEPPAAGAWLTGEILLGVDHFAYMDRLASLAAMPPLIHTWVIEEIQLETTPLVRVEHGHPLYNGPDEGPQPVRDPSREAWRTIERTRMWDDGGGTYRLRCTLVDTAPVGSMERSGPESPYGPLS